MASMSKDIQKAVYTALTDDSTLTGLLADHNKFTGSPTPAAIYGYMPQAEDMGDNSLYPMITIGEDSILDWSTDSESGAAVTITIHIWSRANGWKESKQIEGAVYDVLHRASLSLDNYTFIGMDYESSEHIRDPDGQTLHIAMDFRALIDE